MIPAVPFGLFPAAEVYGFLLVLVRIGAAMSMLPGFGEMTVPMRARMAVALGVTLAVSATVQGLPPLPASGSEMVRHVAAEFVAGALIGVTVRIIFASLQIAGTIISQTFSLVGLFGTPAAGFEGGSVAGSALMVGGLGLLFAADLHHLMIRALTDSYVLMPAAALPVGRDLATLGTDAVVRSFRLAVQIAIPFLVLGVVYNLGLGFINRAMPQFAAVFVALPVSVLGGFVLLALTLGGALLGFVELMRGWLVPFLAG